MHALIQFVYQISVFVHCGSRHEYGLKLELLYRYQKKTHHNWSFVFTGVKRCETSWQRQIISTVFEKLYKMNCNLCQQLHKYLVTIMFIHLSLLNMYTSRKSKYYLFVENLNNTNLSTSDPIETLRSNGSKLFNW